MKPESTNEPWAKEGVKNKEWLQVSTTIIANCRAVVTDITTKPTKVKM
jgi:hypothetical protein